MKSLIKTISLLTLTVLGTLLLSCEEKFLDRRPDDQIDAEQAFTRYEKFNQLVTDSYARIKSANRPLVFFNHFSASAITDESEGTNVEGGITNKFNSGDWGPNGMPDRSDNGQYWWGIYSDIRQANVILEGAKKYNTPDNPLQAGDLKMRLGEVYFHRAYLHYLLVRMYGEAVYVDRVIQATDQKDFKKESVHSLIRKIKLDCDSAYALVPARWSGVDFGRVDKGATLGLKAIVSWIAATPLYNGGTLPNDTRQFKAEYGKDASRWTAARDAAKAVIDFKADGAQRYQLYRGHDASDFKNDAGVNSSNSKVYARLWDMFFSMDAFQNEAVFFVTRDKNCYWQGDLYPPSWGGASRQMPVQEQVDEYEYIAPDGFGYPIYSTRAKADGYDDENPYEGVKRDPRFYRDITYHGATFKGKVINTAEGQDRIGASNATVTGYYHHKILREAWNRDQCFDINGPAIWRLPEFMYIYCEAVNELSGPTAETVEMLNSVRQRSFMAPVPTAVLGSKQLMNEYIQRERRVELYYENNRVWTFRLYLEPTSAQEMAREQAWSAAGSTNDERSRNYWPYPKTQHMINGMRPIEDPAGKIVVGGKKYKMQRYYVESRVFIAPRHYLFPILESELQKTPSLVQNPGW